MNPTLSFSHIVLQANVNDNSLVSGLIAIGICIAIFIVLREVVMWYWKINIIVANQERQIKAQQETNNLLSEQISLLRSQIELTIGSSEDFTDNEQK